MSDAAQTAASAATAAACVLRTRLAERLGEATGREMSEAIAGETVAAALRALAEDHREECGYDAMGVAGWLETIAAEIEAPPC